MPPIIEAVDLHKTYHIGKIEVPALRGISLAVPRGEFVSIVGPSGSGKSTLFYVLGGLAKTDSGDVIIDGVNFTKLSDSARTRMRKSKIGFVFQKFNLLPTLTRAIQHRSRDRYRWQKWRPRSRILRQNCRFAGSQEAPRSPSVRAFGRRAAESGAGTGADQSSCHRSGRRANGQSRLEEFRHRAEHAAAFEPGIRPDGADDHAQSRSRGLRRPRDSYAGWRDCDAGKRSAVVGTLTIELFND